MYRTKALGNKKERERPQKLPNKGKRLWLQSWGVLWLHQLGLVLPWPLKVTHMPSYFIWQPPAAEPSSHNRFKSDWHTDSVQRLRAYLSSQQCCSAHSDTSPAFPDSITTTNHRVGIPQGSEAYTLESLRSEFNFCATSCVAFRKSLTLSVPQDSHL